MLQEVQLLVFGRHPEVLPLVGAVVLFQFPFFRDDGDARLLPERGLVITML